MGRMIKDVLLFCTDVVRRRPHKLDKLMELLNLDSQELLTNENLQAVTSLLKDHYDLLVRFGQIFLPDNYKIQPWKDMTDDRVYCMLIKGDAMYKLTTLDEEHQQFNAMEAARRHEEEERRVMKKRKPVASVPVEDDPLPEPSQDTDEPPPKRANTNDISPTDGKSLETERRGSRSRPAARKFNLAIPFLDDLSSAELQEFLHRKGVVVDGFNTEAMVRIIISDCRLSESSPFEVLPTFLKNFKNR